MSAGVDIEAASALDDLRAAATLLRKVHARLAPDQVWTCASTEVTELLRVQGELASVVEATALALVREADVRCLAADAGQSSTRAWLAQLLRITPGAAGSRIADADIACRKAPEVGAALADGRVNPEQARALCGALRAIEKVASAEEFTAASRQLLSDARDHNARNLATLGEHIVAVLDPDGQPEKDERARQERSLTITALGNGRHRLRGILGDEGAALLNAALDPLAAPRPAQDEIKDARTATQRRADALTDLASHYLRYGDAAKTRGARPHVHITVTADTINGDTGHPFARTSTGENLSPEVLRKICCDAGLTPIVVNTLGEPLAVGRESRTVTAPIWAALVARDLGCVFPGCDRAPSWCVAHHLVHWCHHGETELCNCALLCAFHHDQVHHHGWQIRLSEDGHPELIPPPWVDPLQRPQRNAHWKLLREGLRTDPDRGP